MKRSIIYICLFLTLSVTSWCFFTNDRIDVEIIDHGFLQIEELYCIQTHYCEWETITSGSFSLEDKIEALEEILNQYTSNELAFTLYLYHNKKEHKVYLYIDKNPNLFSGLAINDMIKFICGYLILDTYCNNKKMLYKFIDQNYQSNDKIIPHPVITKWFPYLRYKESIIENINSSYLNGDYMVFYCWENDENKIGVFFSDCDKICFIIMQKSKYSPACIAVYIDTMYADDEYNQHEIIKDQMIFHHVELIGAEFYGDNFS